MLKIVQFGLAVLEICRCSLAWRSSLVNASRIGTVKLSSLAAFSPPAATAKSFILSLLSSRILPQNGRILLNLTVPEEGRREASPYPDQDPLACPERVSAAERLVDGHPVARTQCRRCMEPSLATKHLDSLLRIVEVHGTGLAKRVRQRAARDARTPPRSETMAGNGPDLPAFFGPPITGEQRQSAWLSRSRVLLGQREPASPASAHRHPSQHGAAL